MRLPRFTGWLAGLILTIGIGITSVHAQPPGRPGRGGGDATNVDAMVKRVMTLDKDGDGSIVLSDVKDQRLLPLLKRADANGDGTVTKDELTAQITKEAANSPRAGAGGGPGGGGPGGPGGGPDGGGPPGGGGPGGPGGRGPGGRPQPGQVLPAFMQDELQLTDSQRRDLQELQKDVDARLGKILTAEQQQQLRQMQSRGPGGPGGPGGGGPGGGGPGGPGGGPPGGGPGGRQRPQQ